MIGTYIMLNPYVLHPIGFDAIRSQLSIDLMSNATNHGGNPNAVTPRSIYIHVIRPYYSTRYILIIALMI